MKRILSMTTLLAVGATPLAFSNPSEPDVAPFERTRLSVENKMPAEGKQHLGTDFIITETQDGNEQAGSGDSNIFSVVPYLRYGLRSDLVLEARIPVSYIDRDQGGEDIGLGDVEVGLQLKAFEDIFEYPFVIPHITGVLQTGDEDKGLGRGYNGVRFGVSVGTVLGEPWKGSHGDNWTWILDVSYEARSSIENAVTVAISTVWDVSDRFAVVGEVGVSEDDTIVTDDGNPITVSGGMSYDFSEDLQVTLYGSTVVNTDQDSIVTLNYVRNF